MNPPLVLQSRVVAAVSDVPTASWDRLVAGVDNPFVEHAFLASLERARSVGPGTSWTPRIVLVDDEQGALVGAAPAYRRTDSYGEFVFDHGIAEASHRLRSPYYPKLTVAVPFTPATGPRLLVAPDLDVAGRAAVRACLTQALARLQADESASSTHVLFCADDEAGLLERQGWRRRAGLQFHWRNDGYADFDDFLARLRSEDRKQIRRERRRVADSGLVIDVRSGVDVPAAWWPRVYALYAGIYDRKWGRPYLTRAFFDELPRALADRAVVAVARDPARSAVDGADVVAMTLSFERGRALYGRNWGTDVDVPGLHFELCYYALLERAIARGQALVEAGAQGEHKVKRGYLPHVTHSAHRFADPRLDVAVARFFDEEREALLAEQAALLAHGPFRDGAAPAGPLVAGVDDGVSPGSSA